MFKFTPKTKEDSSNPEISELQAQMRMIIIQVGIMKQINEKLEREMAINNEIIADLREKAGIFIEKHSGGPG